MKTPSPTKLNSNKKNRAFLILLVFSVLSFVTAAGFIRHHILYQRNTVNNTKTELQNLTFKATQNIDFIIKHAMNSADSIANALTMGKIKKTEILKNIQFLILKNPNHYGATICYKPYKYDSSVRLFAPYYHRVKGETEKLEFQNIEQEYDYTKLDTEFDWFQRPINEGNRWTEPYWDKVGKTYMITYSSVFYDANDTIKDKETAIGVVTIDISMDYIKRMIENINLGASGFGALVSREGIYLYHPNTEYVVSQKTLIQIAEEKNDNNRLIMAEKAAKGEGGILDHISTTTQQEAWLVFAPVPLTGWSLQNTFLKNDIEIDVDTSRRQLIWIAILLFTFIVFALGCIYSKTLKNTNQWILIISGTLLMIAGVGWVWSIALNYNPADKISGVKISDKATLEKNIIKYKNRSEEYHLEPPIFVPTGVYIDAIKFSGPSDVFLSGYIWQKYGKDFPSDISKEFLISKATKMSINKINTSQQNGLEIIQYYFEAEIRQKLTHKTYPIEEELIELRIIHKELDHNIVLIPDLDAYKVRSASQLPGLDKAAFISGWKLMNAYYELRKRDLNTNFGVAQSIDKDDFPVLYYNIGIQRNFIDAFISNLTPLIIVSIMLFFLLMLAHKVDTSKVFSTCIAMFFVIVFSHIDIRSKISAQEIFYLEYFFFVTYSLILYVALNAIGLLMEIDVRFYRDKNNFYLQLFWPVLQSVIFLITVLTFY